MIWCGNPGQWPLHSRTVVIECAHIIRLQPYTVGSHVVRPGSSRHAEAVFNHLQSFDAIQLHIRV